MRAAAARPRVLGGERHRVVIVDDTSDIRLLLRTRLSMLPELEVVGEGETGADAVRLVRDLQPHAVILDLMMPVMSGNEAIPLIRGLAPDVRILVYTAAHGSLEGAMIPDAEVAKGTDLGSLVETLRGLLEGEPHGLITLQLGRMPLREATAAFDSWMSLNTRIRSAVEGDLPLSETRHHTVQPTDLLALVGVFLSIGESLVHAAQHGESDVDLTLRVHAGAGRAARRALIELTQDSSSGGVERLWPVPPADEARKAVRTVTQRLLDTLPRD